MVSKSDKQRGFKIEVIEKESVIYWNLTLVSFVGNLGEQFSQSLIGDSLIALCNENKTLFEFTVLKNALEQRSKIPLASKFRRFWTLKLCFGLSYCDLHQDRFIYLDYIEVLQGFLSKDQLTFDFLA